MKITTEIIHEQGQVVKLPPISSQNSSLSTTPKLSKSRPFSNNNASMSLNALSEANLGKYQAHESGKRGNSYVALYGDKKKRAGWWDNKSPDKNEMNHVKELLRRNSISEDTCQSDEKRQEPIPYIKSVSRIPVNVSVSTKPDIPVNVAVLMKPDILETTHNGDPKSLNGIRRDSNEPESSKNPFSDKPLSAKSNPFADTSHKTSNQTEIARAAEPTVSKTSRHAETQTVTRLDPEIESLKDANSKMENSLQAKSQELASCQDILTELKSIKSQEIAVPSLSFIRYFLDKQMPMTLRAFLAESDAHSATGNYYSLKSMLDQKDFVNAIALVQRVMTESLSGMSSHSLVPSFEDLLYVLSKYFVIHLYQSNQIHLAVQTLEQILFPLVQKEHSRGGLRAQWFLTDYQLLRDTILPPVGQSLQNIYTTFHWDTELEKFWASAKRASSPLYSPWDRESDPPPLFSRALATYFYIDESTLIETPSIDSLYSTFTHWKNMMDVLGVIDQAKPLKHSKKVATPIKEEKLYKPRPPSSSRSHSARSRQEMHDGNSIGARSRQGMNDANSVASLDQSQKNFGPIQTDLPPMDGDRESSDFAISKVCGPSSGYVKVMDVREWNGTVIVATAGSEDRTDKRISVWDVETNQVISRLDNGTNKPVVILLFHPSFPELLLSADMEFDIKLWNWKEGSVVRWWKKHHTRIIYRLMLVPGDDTRAVSCSGDQSLKVWSIHSDKPQCTSVHANEPITSFVIVGAPSDPSQQKILASLSYSIRIYKLRTLSMMYQFQLNDLKLNMASHPMYDHLVLISCDNQLRLLDVSQESFVRSYCARNLDSGTRIEGRFSPCGMYIYSSPMDTRARGMKGYDLKSGQKEDSDSMVYIWRVHTGKLEQGSMGAMMRSCEGYVEDEIPLKSSPVLGCKWIMFQPSKTKAKSAMPRKVMVTTGMDKLVRVYL